MAISFNSIPSNLLVPFVAVEHDNSRAQQGPALLPYRALLVGQKTGGNASPNSLHRVTSADQVASFAGRGSMLHRMALAWFAANKFTETWIGVLADSASAVKATGSVVVSGTASASGTINLYLGGERVQIAVASGDSASTIAGAIATAIGKHASQTVTFSAADAADNITIAGTTEGGESVSVTFVGTAGAVTPGAATYSIDTGNNEACASFCAQVNAHADASKLVRASNASAVATLRAVQGGTAGNAITLSVTDAVDTLLGGATLAGGAAGQNEDVAVHASVSSATVTAHAKNFGAVGNDFDIRHSYQDGEQLPAGVSLAITDMASGATNPTLTSLISAMGDSWFHILAHPYVDSTSLTAIENEMSSRFGPMRMIDGVAFTAKTGSQSTVSTLADARNSPHSCIVATNASPTPPGEYAAHVAGVVAYYGNPDPARPFQTLPLTWVKAPVESSRFTISERNLLLGDGASTSKVGLDGTVQIERLVTTYKTNSVGSPDTSYRSVETMLTLLYLRYALRVVIAKFARHKVANDGTRFGPGQAVVTPKSMKGELLAWFRQMEELGLVEGFDQFKTDIIVERNVSDPNRLDIQISPDLINQLVTTAVKNQYLL